MKIAAYARVSTGDQKTAMQVDAMRAYCAAHSWELVLFEDAGYSGTRRSRPDFDRALAAVRSGECQALMVWRFDRASRSTSQLLLLLEELQAMGAGFVSIEEHFDTRTPAGKLMFTVISGMAEFERNVTVERVRAGMRAAAARGTHVGRPRKQGAAILALRHQGLGPDQIAGQLGVHVTTVRRTLRRAAKGLAVA